ncbi:ElaB/YgaM/YqjD family protein [Actibacterium sp. D379-3]
MSQSASTAKPAAPSITDLKAELETLRGDMKSLGAIMSDMASYQKQSLADATKEKIGELRSKGEEGVAEAQKIAGGAFRAAETSVRENPAAALGIASGLGFLIGLLVARR